MIQRPVWLAVVLCTANACHNVRGAPPIVIVDRFDQAVQNELLGYRSTFQRSPSRASALRVDDVFRGAGGRGMRIQATKKATGFCGFWIHFFDMLAEKPEFFDAREYKFLSFWVKGNQGGESFSVQLADEAWIRKQDSLLLGNVEDFLGGGVSSEWQEVLIPLPTQRLDLSRLGGLTLNFRALGQHTIYVDDVCFKTSADVVSPVTTNTNLPRSNSVEARSAMWLWSTAELLKNQEDWIELFDFCRRQRVGQLWMQLPYTIHSHTKGDTSTIPGSDSFTRSCIIQSEKQLRRFLLEAHHRRLKIHALDGAPEYCVSDQHAVPLAVVDAVINFNRRGNAAERFDGLHFDNEPYLLIGWNAASRREEILREFLELNAECQRRVRENSSMQFGVDIPFWWQARDETTGQCHGDVLFRGVRKAASYHCIDMLDNVGIMNYRDSADGADGMIAHGRDLLEYADRSQRARIYMGIETFRYANTSVWYLLGQPRREFDRVVLRHPELSNLSRIAGHRIRVLDDGEYVHVGIQVPPRITDEQRANAERGLRQLAERFHLCRQPQQDIIRIRLRAKQAIDANPEWRGFHVLDLPAVNGQDPVAGFSSEAIMLSKVTYADNSWLEFREHTTAAVDYFRTFKSYGGMAIHFYETYRDLIEKPARSANSD